jgi:hypothetical protein
MKASALHQSLKDYIIGLLAKDAAEKPSYSAVIFELSLTSG